MIDFLQTWWKQLTALIAITGWFARMELRIRNVERREPMSVTNCNRTREECDRRHEQTFAAETATLMSFKADLDHIKQEQMCIKTEQSAQYKNLKKSQEENYKNIIGHLLTLKSSGSDNG